MLGAVAGVFGLIAALAARSHYERHYGYGYGDGLQPRRRAVWLPTAARARTTATELVYQAAVRSGDPPD